MMSSAIAEIDTTKVDVSIQGDDAEFARLLEIETAIEQKQGIGQKIYAEIGALLKEVKDKELWRKRSDSFVGYCEEVWGFEKRRANQLIDLSDFAQQLLASSEGAGTTVLEIPKSERHIRPLKKLPKSDQIAVYKKAVEELPEGEVITERYIAEKVNDFHNEKLKQLMAEAPPAIKEQMKQVMESPVTEALPEAPVIDTTIDIEDDPADTELIEDVSDPTAPSPKATGILSKINALPTGKSYDFAILQSQNLAEKTFVALDGLSRQVKEGGRIVIFCDPILAYQIVDEAAGLKLVIEHSLVRPIEVDPEFKNNYLFPVGHEAILVLLHGNESKDQRLNSNGIKNVAECFGNIPGTHLTMSVKDVANIMLTAYCKAGDRVLCPTAGKHLIEAAIAFGDLDVTYLTADNNKFIWYQGQFGGTENE
jgi:hypothetical protein